jgi:putative PEP-CTERM system histidine kinase
VIQSAFVNAAVWSYGFAAACFVAFAIWLRLGWRSSGRAKLLLAGILASTLWAASGILVAYVPESRAWQVTTSLDSFRYAIWFVFLGSLLTGKHGANKNDGDAPVLPRWVVAAVAAGLVANPFLTEGQPFAPVFDAHARIATFGLRLGLAVIGLMLIEQLIRRAHPQARWALKPLCVGLAGIFAFDLYFYADAMLFGRLDADVWVARGYANVLILPFIAIAVARNPLWTIELHLSRDAVFHSTAILVSGIFVIAIAAAGFSVRYFGGEWGRAFQVVFSFGALLVVVLVVSSGSFRSKLRVFVSKHFFSYRYDYREEWLRFTRTLATENSPQGVQERCIQAIADLVESPAGTLWLRQENDGFRPAARWNMAPIETVEPGRSSLPSFLERTGWVVNLEEYAASPARYQDLVVPEWLVSIPSAWLIVPLVSGSELVGFVVLARPRAAIQVNWEVLDLLKTASRQAASYLGHIQATSALLETRKFDAFNKMSAFVVHDLKNLVAQLSLMLKNAERHRDNLEFQRDMLLTVQHVLDRMNRMLLQLRAGATTAESPRMTDLEAVVRHVATTKHGSRLALDLTPGISALGHEESLRRVIGHLVQNALDATTVSGDVCVTLRQDEHFAIVEVSDTGVGMTPEFVRDRLFKPFESSKPSGMGIGVYECKRYVSSLGGQVQIDSAPNEGTRVRVLLPRVDTMAKSSNQLAEKA